MSFIGHEDWMDFLLDDAFTNENDTKFNEEEEVAFDGLHEVEKSLNFHNLVDELQYDNLTFPTEENDIFSTSNNIISPRSFFQKPSKSPKTKKIQTNGLTQSVSKIQKKPHKAPPRPYSMDFDLKDMSSEMKTEEIVKIPEIESNKGEWTDEEIGKFFEGYHSLGRRWKKISLHFVKTRNQIQITSFAQKMSRENKIH